MFLLFWYLLQSFFLNVVDGRGTQSSATLCRIVGVILSFMAIGRVGFSGWAGNNLKYGHSLVLAVATSTSY